MNFIKKLLAISVIVAGLMGASSASAEDWSVTVGGVSYQLTTIRGTYDDLAERLKAQPWWDNGPLTQNFNDASTAAGFANTGGAAAFAYNYNQVSEKRPDPSNLMKMVDTITNQVGLINSYNPFGHGAWSSSDGTNTYVVLSSTPQKSTTTATVKSTDSSGCSQSTSFTGASLSAGATHSSVSEGGSSSTSNNATLAAGYTAPIGCTSISGNAITSTIGVNLATTIGSQGTNAPGSTSTYYDGTCYCMKTVTTGGTSQIKNVTALTVQPGVIIGTVVPVQIYANAGVLTASKNGSQTTGGRVGGGTCLGITKNVSGCIEGNHDSISGIKINSVLLNVKVQLNIGSAR